MTMIQEPIGLARMVRVLAGASLLLSMTLLAQAQSATVGYKGDQPWPGSQEAVFDGTSVTITMNANSARSRLYASVSDLDLYNMGDRTVDQWLADSAGSSPVLLRLPCKGNQACVQGNSFPKSTLDVYCESSSACAAFLKALRGEGASAAPGSRQ